MILFTGLTLDFLAQRNRLQNQPHQGLQGQESPLAHPAFGLFHRNPSTGSCKYFFNFKVVNERNLSHSKITLPNWVTCLLQ